MTRLTDCREIMARKKATVSPNAHLYAINDSYTMPDGRTIVKDETIKIDGEHGGKFKFLQHVIRTDNAIEWIDCFEIRSGVMCAWRSFRPNRIKPLPKTKKKKTV